MNWTVESFIQELDQETPATRRVLERVPGDRLGWKPHPKSMSLGQLAMHVASVPGAVAELAGRSPYQLAKFEQPSAASAAELIPALDQGVAKARELLKAMGDAGLTRTWKAMNGDTEVMVLPVGALLRTVMLNHWYHHRGQLCVYLRQVGAKVPSVYGPSADENPFEIQNAPVSA